MHKVRTPSEITRKPKKELDLPTCKAQDYRNIMVFYFKIIGERLDNGRREKDIFYLLVMMIRLLVLPLEEWKAIDASRNYLRKIRRISYPLWEKCMGRTACVYNVHMLLGKNV